MNKQRPEWVKKFEKKFSGNLWRHNVFDESVTTTPFDGFATCDYEVKSFISSLLHQQKKELVEKIEKDLGKMIYEHRNCRCVGLVGAKKYLTDQIKSIIEKAQE